MTQKMNISFKKDESVKHPKVAIIILNWNGWEDTIECLESVYQITYPNYEVIVVDNGSEDESVEKIKEYAEGKIKVESKFFEYSSENKPIRIIEYTREEAEAGGGKEKEIADLPSNRRMIIIKNEKNYGFAEGNNIAIRYALKALDPDYVLLLNNDTVVDKEFLGELVKIGERDEKIGAIGPKVYQYNKPKRLQATYSKISFGGGRAFVVGQNVIDYGQFNFERETDYVFGEAFLIKSKVIEDVGLFNPNYFLYWEEIELCIRIKKKGYRLIYCPRARIWHKVGASSKKITGLRTYYSFRNCIWTVKKHASFQQKIIFIPYLFSLIAWSIASNPTLLRERKVLFSMFRGIKDGFLQP